MDEIKYKNLVQTVLLLTSNNNIANFEKMLDSVLTPEVLFVDHWHSAKIDYKDYVSLFTRICRTGKLDFVQTAIEKSSFTDDNNYLIGTATASGFVKACNSGHIEIVKYLVDIDKKHQNIIGPHDGINLKVISDKNGRVELVYDVLESVLTDVLYKNRNMELVEYLFFSNELINHPTTKYEDLIEIFFSQNLKLFDKALEKALNEELDILQMFGKNLNFLNRDKALLDLAQHLIHDFKLYNYPGMEEKIFKEPILNKVYLAEQLNNSLKFNENIDLKKKVKI
jgi:hypothetical protein